MESQPQSPEFGNNPEKFQPCLCHFLAFMFFINQPLSNDYI